MAESLSLYGLVPPPPLSPTWVVLPLRHFTLLSSLILPLFSSLFASVLGHPSLPPKVGPSQTSTPASLISLVAALGEMGAMIGDPGTEACLVQGK